MSEYSYKLKYSFNIKKLKGKNLTIRTGKEVRVIRNRYDIDWFRTVQFYTNLFIHQFSKECEEDYDFIINTNSAINMLPKGETTCTQLTFIPSVNYDKKIINVDVEMHAYEEDEIDDHESDETDEEYEINDHEIDEEEDEVVEDYEAINKLLDTKLEKKEGYIQFPINSKSKQKLISELGQEGYEEYMRKQLTNVVGGY